jgi:exonuclease VII small subunit
MCDGNEARTHLQEKLEQARRLLQQVSDPTTTESLRAFIADLENRLRDLLEPE